MTSEESSTGSAPDDTCSHATPARRAHPPTSTSRRARLATRARRISDRIISALERLRRAVPALDLIWEVATRFRRLNGTVLVGHIAYRLFLWLAPLMLVMTAVLGLSVTRQFDIVQYASEVGATEEFATEVADQASSRSVTALLVGLFGLLLTTLSLVRGLHYAYLQAWELEVQPRRRLVRSVALTLGSAFGLVLMLLVLIAIERRGVVLAFGGALVTIAMIAAALWLMCRSLPRRTTRWLDLAPGAALGAVSLAALQVFIGVYLPERLASASELYGAVGVAVGLLFVTFLIAFVLVGMAFVNAVWTDRSEILSGRPLVLDPEALPRWLRRPTRWLVGRTRDRGHGGGEQALARDDAGR